MTKADLTDLLERLTTATEGSRAMSEACLLAMGWEHRRSRKHYYPALWRSREQAEKAVPFAECYKNGPPDPTRDTQAAIDHMVPAGWHIHNMGMPDIDTKAPPITPWALLQPDLKNDDGWVLGKQHVDAPTLPLAICIARVKQLIAEASDE